MRPRTAAAFSLASWVRGFFFSSSLVLGVVPPAAVAQEAIAESDARETGIVETAIGRVALTESSRQAWGLSETDWTTYKTLMEGPAGLWYSHVSPAIVLGINATSDAERSRFARIVYDQQVRRLDALFAFNRAYDEIARAEMAEPGFSFFQEIAHAGLPASLDPSRSRILAFVGPDCPRCDHAVRELAASGRPVDIYFVAARTDRDISSWARSIGLPADRVRNRTITLNHDRGALARAGTSALPALFLDRTLTRPVTLEAALSGGSR